MSDYQLMAACGVEIDAKAKTLTGAKREASRWASFGAGNIYILKNGVILFSRTFWQNGKRFGWRPWQ